MSRSAAGAFSRFAEQNREAAPTRYVRRLAIAAVAVFAFFAGISGFRAIVQIYRLDLRVPADTLRSGSTVGLSVVTSARTHSTARLILQQGSREETLGVRRLPGNEVRFAGASLNPLPMRDSLFVPVSSEMLERFQAGPAVLRATAIGASQWLRVPPPTIREQAVILIR